MIIIETARLILRHWRADDGAPLTLINQDPQVMEHLPKRLTPAETRAMIQRINHCIEQRGFGLWAVALKQSGVLIGFIGLSTPAFEAPFTPCVEIGWRLSAAHWGQGYATEGAKTALAYGFTKLSLQEIVAFTIPENQRSLRVMQQIGMQRDHQGDFAHPKFPSDHRLSRHLLYRIQRSDWELSSTPDGEGVLSPP
ncbi:GNAT family N-acetyltransferase [unidentified bacterial endosymbiont]|uniref:GNAT family N-acetyltransferase n=1 Tax=unidentified bacterial endosymbiont TaxID=2355 RepID=UPI00209E4564|nr:GNAT family N-acetyltransferase [unidentified bacterial endosymbiont]